MNRRKLPEELRRHINRLAHALAQWSYTEHRNRLELEAATMLKAGRSHAEVLDVLAKTAR
jgi:hypothetical protein